MIAALEAGNSGEPSRVRGRAFVDAGFFAPRTIPGQGRDSWGTPCDAADYKTFRTQIVREVQGDWRKQEKRHQNPGKENVQKHQVPESE